LTGGQAAADRTVPALKKTLSLFFRSSRSLLLPLFCRLSGEATKNIFSSIKKKVSGRLRELLKEKLSVLHASSAVRVCQLLCTAPLETFQTQVLTDNPRQRRPMNTRLPSYLMDSPVGLRLVLLTQGKIINCLNVFFSAGTN